jgi:hypothetical protein
VARARRETGGHGRIQDFYRAMVVTLSNVEKHLLFTIEECLLDVTLSRLYSVAGPDGCLKGWGPHDIFSGSKHRPFWDGSGRSIPQQTPADDPKGDMIEMGKSDN